MTLCPRCAVLLAAMRSAHAEAAAIRDDTFARLRAGKAINPQAFQWWFAARERCPESVGLLTEHLEGGILLERGDSELKGEARADVAVEF
jgi:hypothetical protein